MIGERGAPSAKLTKNQNPSGKGKNVEVPDEVDSEVDSEYEFDAQGQELAHWTKVRHGGSHSNAAVEPVVQPSENIPIPPTVTPQAEIDPNQSDMLENAHQTVAPNSGAESNQSVPVNLDEPANEPSPGREEDWATWLAADGTTLMEVKCGMVEGLTYEKCDPNQVLVHTNQGVVQCAPRDIFSAMIDHLTSQQKIRLARRAASVPPSPTVHSAISSSPLSPSLSDGNTLSPKRALVLSDTPAQAETIPSSKRRKGGSLQKRNASFRVIPRRSLRIVAKGSSDTVMAKAQRLAQAKEINALSSAGIPILTRFPFTRLTDEEIEQLFLVYNIKFGLAHLDRKTLVRAIQNLSRTEFDELIRNAFDSLRQKPNDTQLVVIEQDAQGSLTVT